MTPSREASNGTPAPSLRDAAEALETARFSEAQRLLAGAAAGAGDAERILLEARLRQYQDAAPEMVGLLSGVHFEQAPHEGQRLLLLAIAHTRLGEYHAADEYFERASELAARLNNGELRAEIAYRRGRRYMLAGDIAKAREFLAPAEKGSPARRLDALHLESAILYNEGRHNEQAHVLQRLLEQIDPADPRMNLSAAYATHTLATIAREIDVPEAIPPVERQLRACIWPADLNVQRFQSLKALGWAYALRGDYFNAFRYLKQSAAVAPSQAWFVMALLDRAYLARCLGESRWSRQELFEADEAAASVDWRATRNEERVGLLLLAEMFAPIDSGKAAKYMAQYHELGEMSRNLHYSRSPLLDALADYSAGVTQLALGNAKAGIKLLRESFNVYEREQYDWRAGRCALRLFEATADPHYLDAATEKLRGYPQSWLADELRKLQVPSGGPALPPMQRRVFDHLCEGLSTAQIARQLDRSEYTVKNHIKLIFKAYGVKSRAELLAKVALRR
jgi:DNA-binding CsgD family transcriptional regulator/tetratricopeptide (TPR) repeat protein